MATLSININHLRHNARFVRDFCNKRNLELIGVVKGCYAFSPVIETLQEEGITSLGMSKVPMALDTRLYLKEPPLLIALPKAQQAHEVTSYFKSSLNSEISTIKALAAAADKNHTDHGVILMIDIGDLREGIMPEDALDVARSILSINSRHLKFLGIGANLACCSGTLPDFNNLGLLQDIANDLEAQLGINIETVSVGGSVMLDWLSENSLPSRINQLRIGEAILLGQMIAVNKTHPDLFDDVLLLKGEILELKDKPSIPSGTQGLDALGRAQKFTNKGLRKRAVVSFGVVDTEPSGLTPCIDHIELINYSSDYTIVDVTDCSVALRVGDVIDFKMNYSAMIQTFLSPYVKVEIIDDYIINNIGYLRNVKNQHTA